MSTTVGARIGPYEVLAPLGAGGMGEVYRAKDTRLGREVALKVLPSGVSADPDRRARFEQEARAASALNHPGIVSVFDVGEHGGAPWVAMELVEGRTLREMLGQGPLPTRRTLEIAAQLADGLAKAHAAGIAHRDLKPENIMVSKDGFAKILDFGLAKFGRTPPGVASELVTQPGPATTPGTVLGTVGYMSPEQASGGDVDVRSDQFSLGTIVYEMLTGVQPFRRGTSAETLAAIIREEPEPLTAVSPRTPVPLRWVLDRLLAKDPDDRFASTRDLARDLAAIRDHLSETSSTVHQPAAPPGRWRGVLLPATVAVLALVAGALGGGWFANRAHSGGEVTGQRLTFRRGAVLSARFVPDGRSVVYGAAWDGQPSEVFQVRFDSPESRPLGFGPADVLAVSSSGELALALRRQFLFGWEAPGTLARVALGGGAPREVLDGVQAADWAPDGRLAITRDVGPRRRVEFPIGQVVHETGGWVSHPRISPDSASLAFVDHPTRGDNQGQIMIVDADGSKRRLPVSAPNGFDWSPDGRELWTAQGIATDLAGRQRRQVFVGLGRHYLHDVAPDGRALVSRASWRREIVGQLAGDATERNVTWLDWSHPESLSADGRLLLFAEQNQLDEYGNYAVYLRRAGEHAPVRLGEGHPFDLSPDGRWALVERRGPDEGRVLVLLPTGTGEARELSPLGFGVQSASFFPDGSRVLVLGGRGGGGRLHVVALADGSATAISPEGTTLHRWRAVAPDGRRVVAIGPDGRLAFFPVDGGQATPVRGVLPQDVPIGWAADGRALYLQHGLGVPARVDLLDVATGARRTWKELRPPDPAGVLAIGPVRLSADGKAYVYSYRRTEDVLMVIDGLR